MFTRISNSWKLVKASAAVLRADKELIIFPIVSAIGVVIVTLTFAAPMFLAGLFDALFFGQNQIVGLVVAFLFYLAHYFVIFFANSALVGAAMIRLRGGDPTVGDGFRIAWQHVGPILGYAFIAATVGLLLRWISERSGTLGQIVVSLVGIAWNVTTYLTVPVLVMEEVGPIDAVKRSASLLKKSWGEQIVGNFGISTIFGLLAVAVVLLAIPAVVLAAMTESLALIIMTVLLFVLLLVGLALVGSALSGIYSAALYNYAVSGETGGYFEKDLIEDAFRRKSG
jgi:uncharacterized Tic20 family protein